ncbi:MAG: SpoIIE family protein phosphatase [Sulfuriferula sp.]|nr:SpoIIE family protein phosphatase [Sulfuriferula sp.]
MSLTRRILLPILILAALVMSGMVAIVVWDTEQRAVQDETRELSLIGQAFNTELLTLNSFALGLATEVAHNGQVQFAMATQNRALLQKTVMPGYKALKVRLEIPQYQFHLPPAISFLRVHKPDQFGDDLSSFRQMVVKANQQHISLNGLEVGRAGVGARGIAPIAFQGAHVGTVEFGFDLGPAFLHALKQRYQVDWQVVLAKRAAEVATFNQKTLRVGNVVLQSTTLAQPLITQQSDFKMRDQGYYSLVSQSGRDYRVLTLPLRSYSGEVIGWVEIFKDRSAVVAARNMRLFEAVGLIVVVLTLTALMVSYLVMSALRPLRPLTDAAKEIARGEFGRDLSVYTQHHDEIGALAQAMQSMARQLSQLIHNLEGLVSTRTQELQAANNKITELNAVLTEDNQRMQAEIAITHKIQKMILPSVSECNAVAPLDIAGFMEPADEVGGDYYDVLQHGEQIYLAIGDVTGHGLGSSLVMLMTQSAVRTLVALDETDPNRVMNTLNRALYDNIKRIRCEKNLTLVFLHYCANATGGGGQLHITGQHESILIVRRNGELEEIDTWELGFPLGLVEDISEYISAMSLPLAVGDTVLLYTDGITEAANEVQMLYGIQRLKTVLIAHHKESADAIVQAIVADVKQHIATQEVYDDLTLVVFKQR